jgi:hypothetical protein
MPISRIAPPKRSVAKLGTALQHFTSLKDKHERWMSLLPSSVVAKQALYPHPLYNIRLTELLAGKPLHAAMGRIGWIYFLTDRKRHIACAEVSFVRRVHKNVRLTEGPLVRMTFDLISKSGRDSRVRRRRFEVRSIRAESLHFFCLWFKGAGGIEYFVPVTPLGASLQAKRWVSRAELTDALLRETQRVRDAHERADQLYKSI